MGVFVGLVNYNYLWGYQSMPLLGQTTASSLLGYTVSFLYIHTVFH